MSKLVVLLCIICFMVGALVGYTLGYQHGARAMVNYAVQVVDKIKIDQFNVEINNTKLDDMLNSLENMTEELNRRLNNISIK